MDKIRGSDTQTHVNNKVIDDKKELSSYPIIKENFEICVSIVEEYIPNAGLIPVSVSSDIDSLGTTRFNIIKGNRYTIKDLEMIIHPDLKHVLNIKLGNTDTTDYIEESIKYITKVLNKYDINSSTDNIIRFVILHEMAHIHDFFKDSNKFIKNNSEKELEDYANNKAIEWLNEYEQTFDFNFKIEIGWDQIDKN